MQNQAIINTKRNTIIMIAAFAAVYLIWGSTYLGIKYAIETLPTFLMGGSRFFVAGAILLIWARFSPDYERPKLIEWRTSFIVGALLLVGGNGGVILAQHYIPSSLAALLVAVEPFWIVLLSWLWLGNSRPNFKVILGLIVGFIGVYLLIGGNGISDGNETGQILGAVLTMGAALSWAIGSIYGVRAPSPKSSLLAAGMQMFSGGILMTLVGILTGEWSKFKVADVSLNSWLALTYLIIFGSIIGFTAYSWLMKNVAPELASTYAYVNPVIAVILGWAIGGESLTGQMLLGAGIIVGSVVLITSHNKDEDNFKDKEIHESQMPTGNGKTLSASA